MKCANCGAELFQSLFSYLSIIAEDILWIRTTLAVMKNKRTRNTVVRKKQKQLQKKSGGYMSVDRKEAIRKNWGTLVKITRPLAKGKTLSK